MLAARATVLSRAVVWIAGVAAVAIWGLSPRAAGFDPAGLTTPFGLVGDRLVAPAARWDATWYLGIADAGYAGGMETAFFPLYPLLVAAVSFVTQPVVAGILVSLICCVLGLRAVEGLARLELGEEAARWAVWGLALSPMAFFLSAVYSEALFLAASAGALLMARQGRWAWAGVLGALAASTRSAGILVLVPLALMAWRGPGPRARGVRDAAWLALVPLGLVAFLVALELDGVAWSAPFDAQDAWLRELAFPLASVVDGTDAAWQGARQLLSGQTETVYFPIAAGDPMAIARQNLMNWAWLVVAGVMLWGALRRLPLAYGAYAAVALALPLSYPVPPQPLMSFPRFVLVVVPLWLWWGDRLARWPPRVRLAALAASTVGLAAFSAQFATWHFVA